MKPSGMQRSTTRMPLTAANLEALQREVAEGAAGAEEAAAHRNLQARPDAVGSQRSALGSLAGQLQQDAALSAEPGTQGKQRSLKRDLQINTKLKASYLNRPLTADDFQPSKEDIVRKQNLPNCTECHGCNTELEYMHSETEFLGHTFTNEKGATSSWLFR
jgi:hypothetical protein